MSHQQSLACFKAYDVRGKVPEELNEELAEKIGRAYVTYIAPQGKVVVGRDVRATSVGLAHALAQGLTAGGVDVVDIGLCGTEMVYYAASLEGMAGGIMVTASHNPIEYNGLKFVREGSRPISADTGLKDIERIALSGEFSQPSRQGSVEQRDVMDGYIEKMLSFVELDKLAPLKIVVNAGNGCAGPALDRLAARLPFEFVRINHEPDGSFPNGIPNPLLEENRPPTVAAIKQHQADLGVAWDGDYDRCFLFDEHATFIEGYYIVGLLAEALLEREPGAGIVYDPRLTWNTEEMVRNSGGEPIISRSGHAFIKQIMRDRQALYGGEMSAHHYFREFSYCDSGNIPWLLVAALISTRGKSLSAMVSERMSMYPCSGEINNRVSDAQTVMDCIRAHYQSQATEILEIDGLSMSFGGEWRFNVRASNTEPVLRLNVESRRNEDLMRAKTDELLALIRA